MIPIQRKNILFLVISLRTKVVKEFVIGKSASSTRLVEALKHQVSLPGIYQYHTSRIFWMTYSSLCFLEYELGKIKVVLYWLVFGSCVDVAYFGIYVGFAGQPLTPLLFPTISHLDRYIIQFAHGHKTFVTCMIKEYAIYSRKKYMHVMKMQIRKKWFTVHDTL